MPLLCLSTIFLLLATCELMTRHFFFSWEADSCLVDDAKYGSSYLPHCTSHGKTAEGPWTTYVYNECGYRSKASCKANPVGTTRIALIGSSVAVGVFVPYDQTFPGQAEAELTKVWHRPVEIQDLGRPDCSIGCMFHRVDEALALKPDLLVLTVSPHDTFITTPTDVADRYKPVPPLHGVKLEQNRSLLRKLRVSLNTSSTAIAAEHLLFQDSDTYLRLYMNYGDQADYLRLPLSTPWQKRLASAELLLGEIAEKARAKGVPVVLEEMPDEPQISMLLTKKKLGMVSPMAFNARLADIANRHGIAFVDPLDKFRQGANASKDFYVVNGHLNGEGYKHITAALIRTLSRTNPSALAGRQWPSLQDRALAR